MKNVKMLYAVEVDITYEALAQGRRCPTGYWVIHREENSDRFNENLCVYETLREAREAAAGRDHPTRIVRFIRKEQP